jgi:hypothetical protein
MRSPTPAAQQQVRARAALISPGCVISTSPTTAGHHIFLDR